MPAKKLDINLLTEYGINTKPLGKFLVWTLTYARYIIIGTQIIVLLAFFSRFKLDQQLSDLHSEIDQKSNIILALSAIEDNFRSLNDKVSVIESLEKQRGSIYEVILYLQGKTPSDVYLSSITFNKDHLVLKGKTKNNNSFATFIQIITSNTTFTDVSVTDISQADDGFIAFEIQLSIVAPSI